MARRGHRVPAGADGHYPDELVPGTAAPVIAVMFHLLWEARTFQVLLGAVSVIYGLGAVKHATGSFNIGIYGIAGPCLVALLCTIMLARMKPLAREGSRSVKVPG
jgi:hypothetical protein